MIIKRKTNYDNNLNSPISRVNYDFEALYNQQKEFQRFSGHEDVSLVKMKSKYTNNPYAKISCGCFNSTNPFRQACIYISSNIWFSRFILLTAIANSIGLGSYVTYGNTYLVNSFETLYLIIYTIECTVKITALGEIIYKNSYFRDFWNCLDFFIVVSGWIGKVIDGRNLLFIQTVWAFRPLKIIKGFSETNFIVITIANSLPLLADVMILILFMILAFAIAGTNIYSGGLNGSCNRAYGNISYSLCLQNTYCQEEDLACLHYKCPEVEDCAKDTNPNFGVTSFDNVLVGFLTVLNVVFVESWSKIMFYCRTTLEIEAVTDLYFMIIIIIGSFFFTNLFIAVFFMKFHEAVNKAKEIKEKSRLKVEIEEAESYKPKEPEDNRGLKYCWYAIKLNFYSMINSKWYKRIIDFFIIVNTMMMSTEYYGMSDYHKKVLIHTNIIFTAIFLFEFLIKIIALGLKGYFSTKFNIIELILLCSAVTECLLIHDASDLLTENYYIIRALRALRILKLFKEWKYLRYFVSKIENCIKSFFYLSILCAIIIYVYTLIGAAHFKDKLKDNQGYSLRSNFDNLFWSFITVFQLFTGNWSQILYNLVHSMGWVSIFYSLSFVIFITNILSSLFLAILLEEFKNEKCDENMQKPIKSISYEEKSLESKKFKPADKFELEGTSLFIFGPKNRIRLFLRSLVAHPYFDIYMFSFSSLSTILIAIDRFYWDLYTMNVIMLIRTILTAFFTSECIIKIITFGFISGENTYLKSGWNIIDFFIVLLIWVGYILRKIYDKRTFASAAIGALLAIRPIRMASRNQHLRTIMNSLYRSFSMLFNIFLMAVLNYFMFGIIGVILFKGSFYNCSDFNIQTKQDCTGEFWNGGNYEKRVWRDSDYNFNNIFSAINALFQISTLENWPIYLYNSVDAVGPDKAMKRDYNQLASLYIVGFTFFIIFFIANLYIGALYKNFKKFREEKQSFFLTRKQQEWVKIQRLLLQSSPVIRYIRPKNKFRRKIFSLVHDYRFENLIAGLLALNILFMCLHTSEMSSEMETVLTVADSIFTNAFMLEAILKIIGLGPRFYFANNWDIFDFSISLLSYLSVISIWPSSGSVARIFRIIRAFRIIKFLKHFNNIFNTFLLSLPSMINSAILLLLLFSIYACAGVVLWGGMRHQVYINKNSNFENFYNAFVLLFTSSTGENWNEIYFECFGKSECEGGFMFCGNPYFAVIYWASFQILSRFIFLNMFIVVILENFTHANSKESVITGLTKRDLENFEKAWSKFAPYGDHFIKTKWLPSLLNTLELPLGFKGQMLSNCDMLRLISALNIKEYNGKVNFAEILLILANAVSASDMTSSEIVRAFNNAYPNKIYSKPNTSSIRTEGTAAAKSLAALALIRMWRKYKSKKEN
ncbi:unnamed protein product [Blepharisma stoltei]|uniref:Ion transport domain-containing protein n=1 Tax=Blepharisma stoltei TaxID=1481888 RepID=A0AAU9JRJ8_9CILI|nr:unnamed protein product [Blepharisma stoltei]